MAALLLPAAAFAQDRNGPYGPLPVAPARLHLAISKPYQETTAMLAAQGTSFSAIFETLCQQLKAAPPRFTGDEVHDYEAARASLYAMLKGAFVAARGVKDGRLRFQDRDDWTLHFLAGGLAALLGQGVAYDQAYAKEANDALDPHNFFDLGDFGATMYGARWVAGTGTDFKPLVGRMDARRRELFLAWIEVWASGRRTLETLPKLYPMLPVYDKLPGQLPRPRLAVYPEIKGVQAYVAQGMDHPWSAAWPGDAEVHRFIEASTKAFHEGRSRSFWHGDWLKRFLGP